MGLRPAESILDAGCGTGYFSRRFAADGHPVVGIDLDSAVASYASRSQSPPLSWVVGDMTALPFPDRSFDCVIAVTALCFVEDEAKAVKEIIRVARRRFALGLLNRDSPERLAADTQCIGGFADAPGRPSGSEAGICDMRSYVPHGRTDWRSPHKGRYQKNLCALLGPHCIFI